MSTVAPAGVPWLGSSGRRPLIDYELASGRLTRVFADRSLPGSWNFIIRGRLDAARDVHVNHLREYLLAESLKVPVAWVQSLLPNW